MKLKIIILTLALLTGLSELALSQNSTFEKKDNLPKYGNDSLSCIQNLSLYRGSYKHWKQSKSSGDLADAFGYWKEVLNNCPKASENIFVDGVKMISSRLKKAKDPQTKKNLVDTLMMLYDMKL